MAIVYANTSNFKEQIANGLTLVDFYADWCGPCRMLAPVLEQVDQELDEVTIVKVNVDENEDLARQFGIMSIPTLILFRNGEQIAQTIGFQPKERLIQWINGNK
ncbi:MAG TPA: thioredoxin [Haloplasmataceae bacterium]